MNTITTILPYLIYGLAVFIIVLCMHTLWINYQSKKNKPSVTQVFGQFINATPDDNPGGLFVTLVESNLFASQRAPNHSGELNDKKLVEDFTRHLAEDVNALMHIEVI